MVMSGNYWITKTSNIEMPQEYWWQQECPECHKDAFLCVRVGLAVKGGYTICYECGELYECLRKLKW
jgi:transcription elongation factor Elf1